MVRDAHEDHEDSTAGKRYCARPGLVQIVLDETAKVLARTGHEAVRGGVGTPHVAPVGATAARTGLLLPTRYNDGTPIPVREFVAFLCELLGSYASGVTLADASGLAVDGPTVERDDHLSVSTWVYDEPALRALLARWGVRLGQRAMYLEILDGARLELVPPAFQATPAYFDAGDEAEAAE